MPSPLTSRALPPTPCRTSVVLPLAGLALGTLLLTACPGGPGSAPTDGGPPTEDGGVEGDDGGVDAGGSERPPIDLILGPCDPAEVPPGYSLAPSLECASAQVPVDRTDPDGPSLTLRVGVQRALGASRGAVFQLAGGPGGSSVAQSGFLPSLLPGLRDDFDLVYVDQRGTGASGFLGCPGPWPETREEWLDCKNALADAPLGHLLSADAADDLDDIRRALGLERIHLRGGSYGTRLALEYARRHPEHVASMVLDGVDPPDADFFSWFIGSVDVGMALLFDECSADPACLAVSPSLEADTLGVLDELAAHPRPILVDGSPYLEDEALFRMALDSFVRDAWWRFRLPRALHDRAEGDASGWDGLLSELFGVSITSADTKGLPPSWELRLAAAGPHRDTLAQTSYVAPGLYLAVTCAEAFPNAPALAELRELADAQVFGDGHLVGLAEACPLVPVPALDEEERAPVVSDVPTLLLSGELDLNTPPAFAELALPSLAEGHHVVVPRATHSTMVTPCGGSIIVDWFRSEGDLARVDLGCLDEIPHPGW